MTSIQPEPERSTQDLTLRLAQDRIADLQASAASARLTQAATDRGLVSRFRDTIGRRLIGLGNAIVVDDGSRRRPVRS
jgi:hypothetical protein